jgi:hypothetical protein
MSYSLLKNTYGEGPETVLTVPISCTNRVNLSGHPPAVRYLVVIRYNIIETTLKCM